MDATDVQFSVLIWQLLAACSCQSTYSKHTDRMSDLAAPFLAVFPAGEEALAFWAFEALMQRAARNFRSDEQGIWCAQLLMPMYALLNLRALLACWYVLLLMLAHCMARVPAVLIIQAGLTRQ